MILRLALASRDITYLGSPNPSTFLRLLDVLNDRRDVLARSLESGTFPEIDPLDDGLKAVLRPCVQADWARASELRIDKPLTFADLWPGIKLVTTWTGGACGIALDKLRQALPAGTRVMELGYQSTECRGTMALDACARAGWIVPSPVSAPGRGSPKREAAAAAPVMSAARRVIAVPGLDALPSSLAMFLRSPFP